MSKSKLIIAPKQSILLLLLLIVGSLGSFCPLGELQLRKYQLFSMSSLKHASQFFDVLYDYTPQYNKKTLTGWRVDIVDNSEKASFEVTDFSKNSQQSEEIVYVSRQGNCIIVNDQDNIKAFSTASSSFVEVQNFVMQDFSELQSNEDCSIIRLKVLNTTKVFMSSQQLSVVQFEQGTMFDQYSYFGLDSFKSLYKLESGSYFGSKVDPLMVSDTPLYLKNNLQLQALFVFSKINDDSEYILTVIDTKTSDVTYFKQWVTGQFTGTVQLHFQSDLNSVLATDADGLLAYIEFSRPVDFIETQQITLQNSTYSQNFKIGAHISISDEFVFVYQDSLIQYFQTHLDTLYYLGEQQQNLLQINLNYLQTYSDNSAKQIIMTLVSPQQLETCYPILNTTQAELEEIVTSNKQATLTDGSGNILKCPTGCAKCADGGKCSICSLGYALTLDGKCNFCNGCKTCNPKNTAICTSCFKPQIINTQNQTCELPTCPSNCQTCSLTGVCSLCYRGYSLSNSACVKCPSGCQSCLTDPTMCDANLCAQGYVFYMNGADYQCVQCAMGCVTCSSDLLTNCTSCISTYYSLYDSVTDTLTCDPCITNCLTCSNSTKCEICDQGYELNAALQCVLMCDSSCNTCVENNPTNCTTCFYGATLNSTTKRCQTSLSCNLTQSCLACSDGYVYLSGHCFQCTYQDANCIGCASTNYSICSKCVSKYYLDVSANACKPCAGGCSTCLNAYSCYTCKKGYYMDKETGSLTGECLACSTKCKTCSVKSYLCTSCPTNYTLDGSKCLSNYNVKFLMTIGIDLALFVKLKNTLIQMFVDAANQNKKSSQIEFTSENVIVKRLATGSSVIEGAISSDSTSYTSISSGLSTSLASSSAVSGFPIINYEVSAVGSSGSSDSDSDQTTTNLGLILGISIPFAILAIFGTVVAVLKFKTGPEIQNQEQPYQIQEKAKQFYGNQEPTGMHIIVKQIKQ